MPEFDHFESGPIHDAADLFFGLTEAGADGPNALADAVMAKLGVPAIDELREAFVAVASTCLMRPVNPAYDPAVVTPADAIRWLANYGTRVNGKGGLFLPPADMLMTDADYEKFCAAIGILKQAQVIDDPNLLLGGGLE